MSKSSSPEHNRLIHSAIVKILALGRKEIFADHIDGYNQPKQIGGFIPDILTSDLTVECETADGLAQTHTTEQWTAFFNHAVITGGYFIAVVASSDASEARLLLRQIAGESKHAVLWAF